MQVYIWWLGDDSKSQSDMSRSGSIAIRSRGGDVKGGFLLEMMAKRLDIAGLVLVFLEYDMNISFVCVDCWFGEGCDS